jgi:tRNA nucleotidyltransferase (CCA-adding enzyme)
LLWFIIENKKLELYKIHTGPPLKEKIHSEAFRKKYHKSFVKSNRLFVKLKREFMKPEELIKSMIRTDDYLKEKVKKVEIK